LRIGNEISFLVEAALHVLGRSLLEQVAAAAVPEFIGHRAG